jgi:hypothetical protein
MKRLVYSFLLVAAFATFVQVEPARAQSNHALAVSVPFNFYVKDRALPAGEYIVALVQVGGSDTLKIQSADGHLTIMAPIQSGRTKQSPAKPELVFNRYNDQYFLAQVYGLDENAVQRLTHSRSEEEIVRTLNAATHEKVTVAARRR